MYLCLCIYHVYMYVYIHVHRERFMARLGHVQGGAGGGLFLVEGLQTSAGLLFASGCAAGAVSEPFRPAEPWRAPITSRTPGQRQHRSLDS